MITFGAGATDYFRSVLNDLIHHGWNVDLYGAEPEPVTARLIGWTDGPDSPDYELVYEPLREDPETAALLPTGERRTVTLIDLERVEVH